MVNRIAFPFVTYEHLHAELVKRAKELNTSVSRLYENIIIEFLDENEEDVIEKIVMKKYPGKTVGVSFSPETIEKIRELAANSMLTPSLLIRSIVFEKLCKGN